MTETTTQVRCHSCGYKWDTTSDMETVTCPNCGLKTHREDPDA